MLPDNQLTDYEQRVVADAELMYARNRIMNKVIASFGLLAEAYQQVANSKLKPEWLQATPKIARGEQYLQLPYVVLDYPRNFGREDKFAIRTFFWWGHHFSIHLHLSGSYQEHFENAVLEQMNKGLLDDWYMCVNTKEWEHHFEENNYVAVKNRDELIEITGRPFLKLAKKIPLSEWNKADEMLLKSFEEILNVIAPNYQFYGTDL